MTTDSKRIKVFLNGCCGHMGKAIYDICASSTEATIVAGADAQLCQTPFPVYSSAEDCTEEFDVAIDFSNPSSLDSLISLIQRTEKPVIICTTGFSDQQTAQIHALSQKYPVFYSGNMSLGINVLIHLVRMTAQILYPDFDIEIIEQHHNRKVDAPSGTALMIANEIKDVLGDEIEYEWDRHNIRRPRPKASIGIHSIRAGNIIGEHTVLFAGAEEHITIHHSAGTRNVFARGAVQAALFMVGKEPGFYTMKDLMN